MNKLPKGFPTGQKNQFTQHVNVDSLPPVVCANCGWGIFAEARMIKRISAMQSKVGKPQPLIMQVLLCTRCNAMFNSENMLTVDEFDKLKKAAS